jgi:hypothetical protein
MKVDEAFARLTKDQTSWIICGYADDKCTVLEVCYLSCFFQELTHPKFKAEGSPTGGMPEFIDNLPENDVVWVRYFLLFCII